MAVACAAMAVTLCSWNLSLMVPVAILDGGKALLWVGGAAALGDVLGRTCGVRSVGPLRVATAGGLGLGVFSLLGLGLGLAGALNRPVALAFPIFGYGWLAVDLWRRGVTRSWGTDAIAGWLRRPAGSLWVWAVPAASLTMAGVAACVMPGVLWKDAGDPHPYDVTSYHLQVPREWYEAGRIGPLRHNAFSYFPMNAEVQYLLLDHAAGGPTAPWDAMYAAQWVGVWVTLLMLLAVAGGVGGGGTVAPAIAPAIAAAVASAVPWVVMLAGVAYVEATLMLYAALAVAWAVRATPTEPGGSAAGPAFVRNLIVGGAFAGLACGTKITAVPMLLAAVPVGVAVAAVRAVRWDRIAIGCAAFVVAGAVVVSPWLIRNAAWAHNPLWPVGMSALGADHFTPGQVERFRVAHGPPAKLRPLPARAGVLWRDVAGHWQYGLVLIPAAVLAAAAGWRDRPTWLLVVTAVVVLFVWVGFTHLLARFLVIGVPVLAMAVGRASGGRRWPAGLAVVTAAAAVGWWGVGRQLADVSRSPLKGAFFGVTGFRQITATDPRLRAAMADDGTGQVALVGDAQAFFYEVPMNRLHYRTVFDLPADVPPGDPVATWAGPGVAGNRDWLLVVNPAEIDRLHRTYVDTPPLPPQWAGQPTFLLRGDEVGKSAE